jgi:SAM-dependent methyltransferase
VSGIACPACGAHEPRGARVPGGRPALRCGACRLVWTDGARPDGVEQGADRPFLRRRAHELLEAVERIQGRPGRLLDVGCGVGVELEVARDRGWQGTGLELDAAALRIARSSGLTVVDIPLADARLASSSFDCATLNHTLGRLTPLRPVLAELRRLLRPDGLLFVSVPNLGAWPHRIGAHRLGLAFADGHRLFFTPATLERLLRDAGFKPMGLTTPRWIDFRGGPASAYPAPFRAVNALVERLRLGLEIFALVRVP